MSHWFYCTLGIAVLSVNITCVAAGAKATQANASIAPLTMFQELPYTPLLLTDVPRPRSPCWYKGELWTLAGWRVHSSWHTPGNHEPLARFDGKTWRFYTSPLADPKVLVCDGNTLLVVGEKARSSTFVAYLGVPGGQWRVVPMPPGMRDGNDDEWRFAGGAAIIAYTSKAIWQWKNQRWHPIAWRPPYTDASLTRVVPETEHSWFVVVSRLLGSEWDAIYAHLSPAPASKKSEAELLRMTKELDRVWALIKANKLAQARDALTPLLAHYPRDGQVLFCDARLLWREQNSPQAAMAQIDLHLAQAQGRFGQARLYNLYGNALDELGQHQAMLPWFERAANEYPDPIYLANLAETYEKLRQTELAIRWANRALAGGADSKLCTRILREHGITHPPKVKIADAYLWSISIYALDRNNIDADAVDLKPLETRTIKLDRRDALFNESPGYTHKALPRYVHANGLGVWPDDVSEATDQRIGPIYSADHVHRWRDQKGRRVNPKVFPHPNGTVLVHQQNFEIREVETHHVATNLAPFSASLLTARYVPFSLYLRYDNRLDLPNLEKVHVVGSQVYSPYHDPSKNLTQIMHFKFDTAGHSEALGSIPGQVRPFFLNGQPVWLASKSLSRKEIGASHLRHAEVDFYSLDGKQQVPHSPRLSKGETWQGLDVAGRNFLQSSLGVYRFQDSVWTLFTHEQLGIRRYRFPSPTAKPYADLQAARPLLLAGHTLWIHDNGKYWSVDLNRITAGVRHYTPQTARALSQVKTPWTAGTVDDGKLYLASDEHLTIVQLSARWGDLRFLTHDVVQTHDIGLIRLK